jgi:aminopeptidase N
VRDVILFAFILVIFSFTEALCQREFQRENICSQAKSRSFLIKDYKNIIQTPLLQCYDVKFYFLDLNVENNTIAISGNVTFNASVVTNVLDTFAFELIDELYIDSIKVNGIGENYFRNNDEVFVPLDFPLPVNDNFISQIFYHGSPPTGDFFSGVSTEYDSTWQKNVTWTLSEPFNAREWWPTKQILTDKADSVWVFLTTSSENKAGSIGILRNIVPLTGNKIRYEWKSKYPIDYYLISFAVADYQDYSIYAYPSNLLNDSILIQNYIYDTPECLTFNKQGMDGTKEMLELYSTLLGLYPFHEEKYGHCLAGLSGGMEHQTMTTLGGFHFDLVAHELAHMWFGDNVTCSNWSDIWINEGFATYCDFLALEMIAGDPWPEIWKNNVHSFVLSEPDGSVYVPEEDVTYDNVERIFDSRLTYWKGALIINMIRFEIQNDDLFFQVLKNFQIEFADSTASAIDFINLLNETTGKNFNEFFQQWYYGEGYPIFSFSWKQQDSQFVINSVQTTSKPESIPLFNTKLPCKLFFNDGTDSTLVLNQQTNADFFSFPVEKTIDSIQIDPERWILKKIESIIGIQETDIVSNFLFFPNPVNDQLFISSAQNDIKEVSISDLYGNNLIMIEVKQPSCMLDLSGLSPGVYFLQIKTMLEFETKKIIKI